jgi:hypothetical protein
VTTYVLENEHSGWRAIGDDVDLEAYGRKLCKSEAYQDNDSGYAFWVEFWRDGVRTYAYAEYDCWDNYYKRCAEMNTYEYGTLEEIHKVDSRWAPYVKASKWSPGRDWIKL